MDRLLQVYKTNKKKDSSAARPSVSWKLDTCKSVCEAFIARGMQIVFGAVGTTAAHLFTYSVPGILYETLLLFPDQSQSHVVSNRVKSPRAPSIDQLPTAPAFG